MFRCLIFIRCLNTRESCVNEDMAKWGTNSWEIEETTSHKAGSSAVFNIAFEREGKKEVVTTWGIRIWSPIQVRSLPNRAQLCWADETWCCPCGIVTLNLENGSSVNSDNFDATDWGFNPYVKFKLKPTGIMKKYCKLTVREYKRRCNTIEKNSWSSLSERPSYPRLRDRDNNKELK